MKIKGTCKRCGREFFFEQVGASGGRCPWDGEPFNVDYAVVLVEAMQNAEEAGTRLEQALEDIAAMAPAFTVDGGSVQGKIQAAITALGKNLIKQG